MLAQYRSIHGILLIIIRIYVSNLVIYAYIIMFIDACFIFTSAPDSWQKHSRYNLFKQFAKKFYYTHEILSITRALSEGILYLNVRNY